MLGNAHYRLEPLVGRFDDFVQVSGRNHSRNRWKRLGYLIYGTFWSSCSLSGVDNHLELRSWVCYMTLVENKLVLLGKPLYLGLCLERDKCFDCFPSS